MEEFLFPFVAAFLLALALVPLCKAAAFRLGCVSQPRVDRWNGRSTPLFGGVAIALSVSVGLVVFGGIREQEVLIVCALSMAGVGLVDDIRSLKPATRLITQIILASGFLFFGYQLNWLESYTLDRVLTVAWIVGITNAFNLLDNMDGLCAGVALIAGFGLLASVAWDPLGAGQLQALWFLALVMGAVSGFMVYNFPPASIFMGDTGSLFIGMSIAGLTLVLGQSSSGGSSVLSAIAAPILLLLVPIVDTTLVTISRLLSGRSVVQGGRDHTSHRLVAIGLSERWAVLVLWWLAALGGAAGWMMRVLDDSWAILIAAGILLGIAVFAMRLANVKTYEDPPPDALNRARVTPLLLEFMHKRRVLEVLLDFCIILFSYYAAYRLRFEGPDLPRNFTLFLESLPVVITAQLIALFALGAYRGVWRHYGLMDSVILVKGVVIGAVSAQLTLLYLYRFESYSRAVFVIYSALLILLLMASRASFRLIDEFVGRRRSNGQRLLVYGAEGDGITAVRRLLSDPLRNYRMTGFVDDDPGRHRTRVLGYPVIGNYSVLQQRIRERKVDSVVIATSSLTPPRLSELESLCRTHQVSLLRLHLELEEIISSSRPKPLPFASASGNASRR